MFWSPAEDSNSAGRVGRYLYGAIIWDGYFLRPSGSLYEFDVPDYVSIVPIAIAYADVAVHDFR